MRHALHVVLFVVFVPLGTQAHALPRVYVAPLAGAAVDAATVDLVEDRVLVAARALATRFNVIGASDVKGILDVEADKAALGCDTSSCANEIADALDVDELVTGQLGVIGETWQLTLTRTHRRSLQVLQRASIQARGKTPEALLPLIDDQVKELFDAAPDRAEAHASSFSAVPGIVTSAAGAALLLAGTALYAWSWLEYDAAKNDLAQAAPAVDSARAHADTGVALLPWAYGVGGAGVLTAASGGALWLVSAFTGEDTRAGAE